MRVNLMGRGVINGIGLLPITGIDLSEDEIKRLLNFNNVRVYDASNGGLITKKRFADAKRKQTAKKTTPVVVKPTATPAPVTVTPETVVEQIAEPVVKEPIVETPIVEVPVEASIPEETVETAPVEVEAVEETETTDADAVVEDEQPKYHQYNSKKKNKNHK